MSKATSEILSELFHNKELEDCLVKLVPKRFRDDFKQELFLILLSKEDSVLASHKDGKLLYYTVRVILHMTNREGILNRQYKKKETAELKEAPVACEESFVHPRKNSEMINKYFMFKVLVIVGFYLNLGNNRKVVLIIDEFFQLIPGLP